MSGKPLREGNLRVDATPFIPRQTLISTINDTSPQQTQKLDSISLTSSSISPQKLNLVDETSLTSPLISTQEFNSVITSLPSNDSNSTSKLNSFCKLNNGTDVPEFNPKTVVYSQSTSILNSEVKGCQMLLMLIGNLIH